MNLIIVAGGLGSRLAPLTNNIPKLLVNIGKNTGYVEMIRYWEKQIDFKDTSNTLTVVVHSAYAALVLEYHKLYFPQMQLIVKTVDAAKGSAHAILSTCGHVVGKEALFVWCDVIPVDDIEVNSLSTVYDGANVIFTNYNNSNRYELVSTSANSAHMKPMISPTERGGCFGLYFIPKFHVDVQYQDGEDFIDVIHQFGKIREHRLQNIIDFGDMPKLIRTRSKADEAREFNSVEFIDEYVLKQATNNQGRTILEREMNWYKELDRLVTTSKVPRPAVPRTWIATDGSGFFMSRVKGVPIWKAWPDLSPVDRNYVLSQVIKERESIFNLRAKSPGLPTILEDVKTEAHTKLLNRYAEIRGVVSSFGQIESVNGHTLRELDPERTINRLHEAISSYYTNRARTKYGFIHGDLQLSNSMVDLDTLKVTIIDPRGYFGKTELAGLEDYDIGKLLYALSGYDTFNCSREFHIKQIRYGVIEFDIPEPSQVGIENIMDSHFKLIHRLWLAVCWIGLGQYIKNDPVKSVCAHYHGLVLAEQALAAM